MNKEIFMKRNGSKRESTIDELIERGFAPQNGKIDVMLIHPPTSVAERYGREDMGDVGGNQIPLGIASLAAYLREKKIGVGVLDCAALGIDANKTYEVIKKKDPAVIGFSSTTYVLGKAIKLVEKIRNT